MSNRFFYRRRAERFAQLLDEANGARRHHVRTSVDGELSELVQFGHRVRTNPPPAEVDPDFRTSLRALLVATAERDGAELRVSAEQRAGAERGAGRARGPAVAAVPAGNPPESSGRRRALRPLRDRQSSRVRARGAIVLGVVAGAIAVSGMSAASENALPGDALYGMKRSTERAQLALATSDLNRGQLFLDFARTRLTEAEALRGDVPGFVAVLDDMDSETRQGVRLLTTAAVQRGDSGPLDAIAAFLDGQRGQVAGLSGVTTTRVERDRTVASLDLLDLVRKRTEGLRAALSCGAGPSARTDNLGPHPRPCTQHKTPEVEARPGLSRQEETNRRPAAPEDRTDPADAVEEPVAPGPGGDVRSGPGHAPTG